MNAAFVKGFYIPYCILFTFWPHQVFYDKNAKGKF